MIMSLGSRDETPQRILKSTNQDKTPHGQPCYTPAEPDQGSGDFAALHSAWLNTDRIR